MTQTILLLRIEHHQMADILDIAEAQLNLDAEMDTDIIRDIVEYFCEYPDRCHHPVEDLVFRSIEKRDPDRAATVARLLHNHAGISELTKKLRSVFDSFVAAGTADDDDLRSVAREFVDTYRAHMKSEEEAFFPLALEALSGADWAEIEYVLFDASDPLYDKEAVTRFRSLRETIDERAVASFRRGAYLREARTLGQLTGVEAFNALMKKVHPEYSLVEHPEGSFGLEHQGHTVIDIPKCDLARAAWCAYYYVAATTGDQDYRHS